MPTTVVPGFLYLGSYDTASRQELLKAMNISHILNVSCQQPCLCKHACPVCMLRRLGANTQHSASPAMQTVPTCQALFKNTFTYHTATVSPPPFEECFNFLGKPSSEGRPAVHVAHACRALVGEVHPLVHIGPADAVNAEDKRVMVYCMSGVSRCAVHATCQAWHGLAGCGC